MAKFNLWDIVIIENGIIHHSPLYNIEVDLSGVIGIVEASHFANMEEKTGGMMYHVKHFIPPVGGVCLREDQLQFFPNPDKAFLPLWCVIDHTPQDKYTSSVFQLNRDLKYWSDILPKGTKGIIVCRLWDKCFQSVLFFDNRAFMIPVEESYFMEAYSFV